MKTEVIMQRQLFGETISQKSKSEFFSATDLVRAGNKWRLANGQNIFNLSQYLKAKSTLEFVEALTAKYNLSPVSVGRGRNSQTWVHPLLFIDIALSISPNLKIEVYEWLFDYLIKNRNDSGDSYKAMCGSLYEKYPNKKEFYPFIQEAARVIKMACGVKDWQTANEKQLKMRDSMHDCIMVLADTLQDPYKAVETGVNYILRKSQNN